MVVNLIKHIIKSYFLFKDTFAELPRESDVM